MTIDKSLNIRLYSALLSVVILPSGAKKRVLARRNKNPLINRLTKSIERGAC